jgi:hypothetical protein
VHTSPAAVAKVLAASRERQRAIQTLGSGVASNGRRYKEALGQVNTAIADLDAAVRSLAAIARETGPPSNSFSIDRLLNRAYAGDNHASVQLAEALAAGQACPDRQCARPFGTSRTPNSFDRNRLPRTPSPVATDLAAGSAHALQARRGEAVRRAGGCCRRGPLSLEYPRTERYSGRNLRRDDVPRNELSVAGVPVPLDQRRVHEQLESGQA